VPYLLCWPSFRVSRQNLGLSLRLCSFPVNPIC
jgi:hypothetical protein